MKTFWNQCFVLFFVIFLKQWWMQTYFALIWTVSVYDLYWRTVVSIVPQDLTPRCVWISDQFGGLCYWILELFYLSYDARNCLASSDWMICYINFDLEMKQQIKAIPRSAICQGFIRINTRSLVILPYLNQQCQLLSCKLNLRQVAPQNCISYLWCTNFMWCRIKQVFSPSICRKLIKFTG